MGVDQGATLTFYLFPYADEHATFFTDIKGVVEPGHDEDEEEQV